MTVFEYLSGLTAPGAGTSSCRLQPSSLVVMACTDSDGPCPCPAGLWIWTSCPVAQIPFLPHRVIECCGLHMMANATVRSDSPQPCTISRQFKPGGVHRVVAAILHCVTIV